MKLILGSSSKFRFEELQKAGYIFDVVNPDIDEKNVRTQDLFELPIRIAEAKCDAVIRQVTEPSIIITADAIVIANNELREKPASREQNRLWLESYSGNVAHIIVGVVVHNMKNGKRAIERDDCVCYFKDIPKEKIDWYLEEGTCLQTAGGFTNEIVNEFCREPIASSDRRRGIPIALISEMIKKVSE